MSTVDGWHHTNLGNLLTLVRNGYSGQQVGRVTDFPVSRIETISEGRVDTSKVGFVESIPDSYLLESGDILFSNINSLKHIGKVARVEAGTKLFHGMNLLVLRPVDEIDKKFLFYVLVRAKPWSEKIAAQAINQASINQTTVRELPVHVPENKPEQTKIAEVLSTVDRAIEQTEALIAKQERIKTGLMQDLLTRGIDEHGNLRSEETHEFKDSALGRIPVEWEEETLGRVIGPIVSGWSPTCDAVSAAFGEWGVLKTTAVVWSGYNQNENKRLPSGLQGVESIAVQNDDILITRKGPVERVGVVVHVNGPRARLMIPDTVFRTRLVESSNVLPAFLPHALGCATVQSDWFRKKIGLADAQVNLNHSILRTTVFPKLPPEEQLQIVELVEKASERLSIALNSLNKLRRLKTALMQDLLTGNKHVTPLLEADSEQAGSAS